MEHYITAIEIHQIRHLSDIVISLNAQKREHLLLTGKNGSGKTSLLQALQKCLCITNNGAINLCTDSSRMHIAKEFYNVGITFNDSNGLESLYRQGDFILAMFPAERKLQIIRAQGVEDIHLDNFYGIDSSPGKLLHKYMVHLKTQQAYAKNEGDFLVADRIQNWFDRFETALQILLDDSSLSLEYSYKEYDFRIVEKGRESFGLDELSDGYSAAIHIISDLILRMDKNWLLKDNLSQYDIEGVVLIDELETHLHIELQKKILPFLVSFFPRIQFIVTTHSPYILNSVSNARAYDLERKVELDNLQIYSSDALAEGYFDTDEYSEELKKRLNRYEDLINKTELSENERAERAQLRIKLKEIPYKLSKEIKEHFDEIERNRV